MRLSLPSIKCPAAAPAEGAVIMHHDLFTNRIIFRSKSHLAIANENGTVKQNVVSDLKAILN